MGLSCSKNIQKDNSKDVSLFEYYQKSTHINILPHTHKTNKICVIFLTVSGKLGQLKNLLSNLDEGGCPDFSYSWIGDEKFIFMEKSLNDTLAILENKARRVFIILLCDSYQDSTDRTIKLLKNQNPEKIFLIGIKQDQEYGFVDTREEFLLPSHFSIQELNDMDNAEYFKKMIENCFSLK